jgi:hypothetical protein
MPKAWIESQLQDIAKIMRGALQALRDARGDSQGSIESPHQRRSSKEI